MLFVVGYLFYGEKHYSKTPKPDTSNETQKLIPLSPLFFVKIIFCFRLLD